MPERDPDSLVVFSGFHDKVVPAPCELWADRPPGCGLPGLRLPCSRLPGSRLCQADLSFPSPPAVSPREAQRLCLARVCSSSQGWLRKHLGCWEDSFLAEITWDLGRSVRDPRRPSLMTAR